MRFDDVGIFWKDVTKSSGSRIARIMPEIPDTGWEPPKEFPRLSDAKVLAVDTETFDPEMGKYGPGWARKKGHIVGVSIGADNDGRWYFPVRHEVEPETNMDPEKVFPWLRGVLSTRQPKVGANLIYDIGWLQEEGVEVLGPLYDVQFAEALLTETGNLGLDNLANKYLGESKTTSMLYSWCSAYYGGSEKDQRKNIYRSPARLAGPYAEGDVDLPLKVLPKQFAELRRQNLTRLFKRENALIPLLVKMRTEGVSVDVENAQITNEQLTLDVIQMQKELNKIAGCTVDVYSNQSLSRAFDRNKLHYPKTKKGNPSFVKTFLEGNSHAIPQSVTKIRRIHKLQKDFIQAAIIDSSVNGKVYCQFHPLRGEEYGTRSGRFSSSTPNLQQIPSRDEIYAAIIRGFFIPDLGHRQWRKMDASQIEYRFLAHFAVGEGSEALRRAYNNDRKTDYHKLTQELVKNQTGVELGRKPTKNINFGFIYGMGKKTLAKNLGLSVSKANELFSAYHRGAPFAAATMEHYMDVVQELGYVETIAGRRSRFNLYEPIDWYDREERAPALPFEKAIAAYGPCIQRSQAHKALNRVLQGSAAEMLKEAMLQCWENGVFDETGVPRLTVHDELDFSDPGGKDAAFSEVKRIFENAIKLSVPVLVDEEVGPDWGHVK